MVFRCNYIEQTGIFLVDDVLFSYQPDLPARTWQDGTLEFCGEAYNYQTLVFDIS